MIFFKDNLVSQENINIHRFHSVLGNKTNNQKH